MRRRSLLAHLVAALLVLAGLVGGGPAGAAPAAPLTVLAASSLTEVMQALGAAWQAQGHGGLTFSFDASSRLARQVEAGAPADLVVSADAAWIDWLAARSLVVPASRVVLAGNRLVAVVPAGAAWVPATPAALADPRVRHLALAGENVPAGRYAQAALLATGAWDAVQGRIVRGDDVRAALAWVAAGEAEAGVVYATDARIEARVQVAFPFAEGTHPPILYPAAVTGSSAHPADAARFLAFCRSPEAVAIFRAAGFTPAPP